MGRDAGEQINVTIRELVTDVAEQLRPAAGSAVLARLRALELVGRLVRESSDHEMLLARGLSTTDAGRGTHTWAEIGSALGISSQAARQRAERRGQLDRRRPVETGPRP